MGSNIVIPVTMFQTLLSSGFRFFSDALAFPTPFTPVNMHIDTGPEITKVKRQAFGPTFVTDPTVLALLHFDGVNGGPIIDEVGQTWTVNGGAVISDTVGWFDEGLLLAGSTDYISSVINLGAGDYSIEFIAKFNPNGGAVNQMVIGWGPDYALYYNQLNNELYLWDGVANVITVPNNTLSTNYTYYCISRSDGVTRLDIGVSFEGTTLTMDADLTNTAVFIGQRTTLTEGFGGSIDELRLSSIAVTPAVPTAPYSISTPSGDWDTLYTATYVNDEILLNGVLLFTLAGITDFDLDFDNAGYPVVAYSDTSDVVSYTHQDTTHTVVQAGAGNPFVVNELPEDVNAGNIISYEIGDNAAYKLSHESYATQRLAADITGGGSIEAMGMVDDGLDKRLAMEFTPPVTEI